ncbi:hypothetical protein D3C80_586410 [compost metagenome]
MQIIDADNLRVFIRGTDNLCSDLRPAAGCSTQIDNFLPLFQKIIAIIDFNQLVGRARTITVLL